MIARRRTGGDHRRRRTVGGAELAGQAIAAGMVDELQTTRGLITGV
jgi:dihydrofolate reductase